MKRLNKLVAVFLAFVLTCGNLCACAEASGKEEIVYVVLNADGSVNGTYVVNVLPGGEVMDYGEYTSVHALNTEDALTYEDGIVRFTSDATRVYYQGNMENALMPWVFEISYFLDGQPIAAEALAGASGHFEMRIAIKKNPQDSSTFYESHALQITAVLDTQKCTNITAEGATQANVGSNRQLSYILLPGNEKEYVITADVVDFEMDALAINGLKMGLDVEISSEDFSDQVTEIQSAATELNDGAQDLYDGAVEVKDGVQTAYDGSIELRDGAQELYNGLTALTGNNETLMNGAGQIVDAILASANETLAASSDAFEQMGITVTVLTRDNCQSEMERLQSEMLAPVIAAVSQEAESVLRQQVYDAVYAEVYAQVSAAMGEQATQKMIAEQAEAQMQSAETQAVMEEQIAAQKQSETFLASMDAAVQEWAASSAEYQSFASLKASLDDVMAFYTGLSSYTAGVSDALTGCSDLLSGATELAGVYDEEVSDHCTGLGKLLDGAIQLADGASDMKEGASEFKTETDSIDTRITEEADRLIAARTGADVATVSFADSRNGEISSVQFVFSTPSIHIADEEPVETAVSTEDSFIDKLKNLFD